MKDSLLAQEAAFLASGLNEKPYYKLFDMIQLGQTLNCKVVFHACFLDVILLWCSYGCFQHQGMSLTQIFMLCSYHFISEQDRNSLRLQA